MLRFQIPAMNCGHCIGVITQAVQAVDPQARVDADLSAHSVSIDSVKPREAFVTSLGDAGYPPVVAVNAAS